MEAYPLLVRKRIIELYAQNKSTKEIAQVFGICRSGTRRIKQNLRERGTIAPQAGTPPRVIGNGGHDSREATSLLHHLVRHRLRVL